LKASNDFCSTKIFREPDFLSKKRITQFLSGTGVPRYNGNMTHQLKQNLTLFGLVMIGVGASIGSGIFRTPGLVAQSLPEPESKDR
jgi:hypothetical protein